MRNCAICEKELVGCHPTAKQCGSEKCRKEFKKRLNAKRYTIYTEEQTCAREGCDNKFTKNKKSNRRFCCEKCRVHVYLGKPQINGPVFEANTQKADCLQCGKSILKKTTQNNFCSARCGQNYRKDLLKKERKTKIEKAKCVVCNTVFERATSPKLRANENGKTHIKVTCSKECLTTKYREDARKKRAKIRIQITKNCPHCKKDFSFDGYKGRSYGDGYKKYCSRACSVKAHVIINSERMKKDGRKKVNAVRRKNTKELSDYVVRQFVVGDFERDGLKVSASEISPQMVEDRRLLIQAKRAWRKVTGKKISLEGFRF